MFVHAQMTMPGSEKNRKDAHAGSRTRVTSMGGLYDAATLHALLCMFPLTPSAWRSQYWPRLTHPQRVCQLPWRIGRRGSVCRSHGRGELVHLVGPSGICGVHASAHHQRLGPAGGGAWPPLARAERGGQRRRSVQGRCGCGWLEAHVCAQCHPPPLVFSAQSWRAAIQHARSWGWHGGTLRVWGLRHGTPCVAMAHVHYRLRARTSKPMRMPGVKPGSQAWEACMMPLHYMRCLECSLQTQSVKQRWRDRWLCC